MALDRPDGNDERTRKVTITRAGVPLDQSTPTGSRPPQDDPIQSVAEIGRRTVLARVAADRTRWCRCCDTTAAPGSTSVYCPEHLRMRNPFLKRLRRQEQREAAEAARTAAAAAAPVAPVVPDGMVLAPREALVRIAREAARMTTHVTRASLHFRELQGEGRDTLWLDNLMWSAKHLDAAITSGLLNGDVLSRQVVPASPLPTAGDRPQAAAGRPVVPGVSVPGRTVPIGRADSGRPTASPRTTTRSPSGVQGARTA